MRAIELPALRPSVARALNHPWRQITWLWFLRFLRRDLPKPLLLPLALLRALLLWARLVWVLVWAMVCACFAYSLMWSDAAKAGACMLIAPLMIRILDLPLALYRRVNR